MSSTAEPLLALQDDARRPLVAVAEINREGLIASHHSCKGLAFGVASMLKRGCPAARCSCSFLIHPLEVEFEGKGGSVADGARLQISDCDDTAGQVWGLP
jgi:hypothetical protein